MNDTDYTVSELAACVGAASERQEDLWLRRLRHWTTLGIIPTLGPQHGGPGRHRRYGGQEIYLAAVLLNLADRGTPVGALKAIGDAIASRKSEKFVELWEAAKQPDPEGCVWAGFAIKTDDELAQEPMFVDLYAARGRGLNTPEFRVERSNWIVQVNLSDIFRQVRL